MPNPVAAMASTVDTVRTFSSAGLLGLSGLNQLRHFGSAARKWGLTLASGYAASAAARPDATAIIDERGTLTFAEVHQRTNSLAHAWAEEGFAGKKVAIMARNHRGFVDATVALSKIGADALYLNTGFAGPQLVDVCKREEVVAVVYDQEFAKLLSGVDADVKRCVAWIEDEATVEGTTLERLIEGGDPAAPPKPERDGRIVILTSGTTGTPKGASRWTSNGVDAAVGFLSKIPLRACQTTLCAAPLFHSWGFAHFTLGLLLSTTLVLQRRFDPEATLAAIDEHDAEVLAVVPVMLQRILELPEDVRRKYDTSSLRVVAASGSALTGALATRWMDAFGDNLYNLYGSTEVAFASIATPEDMRVAPDTAGKPPWGVTVRIFDEKGSEVPIGSTGRIFVGNKVLFDGYTGGGTKEVIEGMMSSGDVGHLDENGRLFVEGRDDDMIVSGGENVFPAEVEDLIGSHEAVAEIAVIGVKDEQFGQRLKAFVVLREGQNLTEDDVKEHVRAHLARYKIPRDVEFLDELPRNATGKILKRELRDA